MKPQLDALTIPFVFIQIINNPQDCSLKFNSLLQCGTENCPLLLMTGAKKCFTARGQKSVCSHSYQCKHVTMLPCYYEVNLHQWRLYTQILYICTLKGLICEWSGLLEVNQQWFFKNPYNSDSLEQCNVMWLWLSKGVKASIWRVQKVTSNYCDASFKTREKTMVKSYCKVMISII